MFSNVDTVISVVTRGFSRRSFTKGNQRILFLLSDNAETKFNDREASRVCSTVSLAGTLPTYLNIIIATDFGYVHLPIHFAVPMPFSYNILAARKAFTFFENSFS